MTDSELLTDKYLAELLARDARDASIKYSTLGLEEYASRQPSNKPKPNTRFLRNIIKDTDNHNAALLAREAADARSKLDNLSNVSIRRERTGDVGSDQIRKRQLGNIEAILGGGNVRGHSSSATRAERSDRSLANIDDERRRHAWRREEDEKRAARRLHTSSEDEAEEEQRRQKRKWRHELRALGVDDQASDHRKKRRRERSNSAETTTKRRRDHRRGDDFDGADRKRRREYRESSPEGKGTRYRSRSPGRRPLSTIGSTQHAQHGADIARQRAEKSDQADEDPLEAIIGPMPQLSSFGAPTSQPRGRGKATYSRGDDVDSRLAVSYDPRSDVALVDTVEGKHEEDDDWEQALEALRDRQRWMEKGADRLRTAGFTEQQIGKWKKSGSSAGHTADLDENDVVWAKKGQGREWDRGKAVQSEDDDVVDSSAFGKMSGRFKGT